MRYLKLSFTLNEVKSTQAPEEPYFTMPNQNNKFKDSLTTGLTKGWSGFVWMLKIIVPISLMTSVLAWSGWIDKIDFILEPAMGVIGLPPVAALPLVVGLLTGPYGAIAAMAPLPLTVNQMTLIALFLLISHNLIQEGVIQKNSGLSFLKATTIRLTASIVTVMLAAWFMGSETATVANTGSPVIVQASFISMFKTWGVETLVLFAKILVIIVSLMIILEFMKNYDLIDRVVSVMTPVLKILGLGSQTGLLWLTAATFGLTYGAAVIVEETKAGNLSKDELERLQISIGINHSIIEDPVLFISLGLSVFWMCVPRVAAAIIAVQLYIVYNRLMPLSGSLETVSRVWKK